MNADSSSGVLYRTGPRGHQFSTSKNTTFNASHWFDGFSQTHRFELIPPANGEHIAQVNYSSRNTCDELIEKFRKEGDMSGMSFGQQRDPCESFFKKVMSSFHTVTARDERGISGVNIGVTVKANMPMPAKLTKGVASQQDS